MLTIDHGVYICTVRRAALVRQRPAAHRTLLVEKVVLRARDEARGLRRADGDVGHLRGEVRVRREGWQ